MGKRSYNPATPKRMRDLNRGRIYRPLEITETTERMKYRRLGSSGLLVSTIGLGTNNFGEILGRMDYESAKAALDACRENGINFIDTADSYSGGISEDFIGKAVKDYRQEVIIGTKAGMPWAGKTNREGLSAAHLKY